MLYLGKFGDQRFWTGRIAQNSILKINLWGFPGKKHALPIKTCFGTKNSHRNHNTQVRIVFILRISGNFQTKNVCTVILHILDRTDCQKHNLQK